MSSRPRALIVDDEAPIRVVVRDMLEFMGVEADTAADGHEALGMLAAHDYSFVITDFMMPRMTGIDFAEAARRDRPGVPLAILTGSVEPSVLKQIRGQGLRVLSKPISLGELSEAVAALLVEAADRARGPREPLPEGDRDETPGERASG